MAAGESNSRSSCLNLSNPGPLGNAQASNGVHSGPPGNAGSATAGGLSRSAGSTNPQPGLDSDVSVRPTPSTQHQNRQAVGQSAAAPGADAPANPASNMTAASSTRSADPPAVVSSSLPGSPASVLVYREPVYNWQATKSTVKERFAFLFNNEVLSDVHFLVGKGMGVQRIPAHR